MSALWQMGAAVTGEILLISCNLSPLHAQSHCGAGAFPATYGRMAEGVRRLLQNIFRDLRCRDQQQKLKRCCESAEYWQVLKLCQIRKYFHMHSKTYKKPLIY